MKTKILGLFGVFAIFLCLAFVSAATEFSVSPSAITFTPTDDSNDITITNTNVATALSVTLSLPTIEGNSFTSSKGITLNLPIGNATNTTTITPSSVIDFSTLEFGESFSGNITITDGTDTEIIEIKIENDRLCEYDNPGDLEIKKIDFNNLGMGDDEEWYPYDVIEVEVKIENKDNDDDVNDISLEWGLYDSNGEWIIELIEEDDFDVDADEDETITFELELNDDLDVDLEDLNDGSYTFYVRATGETDSDQMTCVSDSEKIDVIIERDFVVLSDLEIVGSTYCGSTIQVKAEVVNIGSKDQDDVYIDIYNLDLGVDEQAVIGDIDSFDDKTLSFEFSLPKDLDEKRYYLHLDIYDDDNDIYENSNDDKSMHSLAIDVSGNCEKIADASVYASLESGGKAGQEMQIKSTVTNTGSEKQVFTIEVADYSTWAELVSIESSSVTLDEGESEDIMITLNVDTDAPEQATFNIILTDENENTVTQPISVTIEKGFSLTSLLGEQKYTVGIAALSVILIIIIIILAVKISRR